MDGAGAGFFNVHAVVTLLTESSISQNKMVKAELTQYIKYRASGVSNSIFFFSENFQN